MRYIFSFLFLSGFYLYGQTVTHATSQNWSGGACCYSGTNYNVNLSLANSPRSVKLQKIYHKTYGEMSGSLKEIDRIDGTSYFTISFWYSSPQNGAFIEMDFRKNDMPAFTGTVLILLNVDGQVEKLSIEEFQELEQLAYP